jgi:hypothetical protein
MMGQADSPEIARVRQFAAAVREGMAGRAPQPGVMPTMTANDARARQAGVAAASILGNDRNKTARLGPRLGPRRNRPMRPRDRMRIQVQDLASMRAQNSMMSGNRPAMFGKG